MILGALMATSFGPFVNADGVAALGTGMTLVAAMAVQNAAHRVHLASAPPSTIMTGNTTQLMMDLGDLIHGLSPEKVTATRGRLRQLSASVLAFAGGCALGALLFALIGVWCFWIAPAILLITLPMRRALTDADR
jgi:uncharacterized membrane protein YoaK (UPF0700 family)